MKPIIQLLLVLTLTSVTVASDPALRYEENDIREVVFRYQLEHWKSTVVCLAVGKNPTDPSDEFMKRFDDHQPRLRKASECSTDGLKGVTEKSTGKHGVVLRVTAIKWISDKKVEVTGGYYQDGLSASGNTYTVIKQKGLWKVAKDKMNWISRSLNPVIPFPRAYPAFV